jgi:hypothetical protein
MLLRGKSRTPRKTSSSHSTTSGMRSTHNSERRITERETTPGGFNIAPCGASVNSVFMQTKTPAERGIYWQNCRKYLRNQNDYNEFRKQKTELRRKRQRREWDEEMDAFKRDYDAGSNRRRKIIADVYKVRPQMDRATMEVDELFAQYEAFWEDVMRIVSRK